LFGGTEGARWEGGTKKGALDTESHRQPSKNQSTEGGGCHFGTGHKLGPYEAKVTPYRRQGTDPLWGGEGRKKSKPLKKKTYADCLPVGVEPLYRQKGVKLGFSHFKGEKQRKNHREGETREIDDFNDKKEKKEVQREKGSKTLNKKSGTSGKREGGHHFGDNAEQKSQQKRETLFKEGEKLVP